MSINSINQNTSFKGFIKLPIDKRKIASFDTDKIMNIETRNNGEATSIKYAYPLEISYNGGYSYNGPAFFPVNYDINTILNAYNAAKNTDLTVDLSNYKKSI